MTPQNMTLQEEILEEFERACQDTKLFLYMKTTDSKIFSADYLLLKSFLLSSLRRQAEEMINEMFDNFPVDADGSVVASDAVAFKKVLRSKYLLPLIEKHD